MKILVLVIASDQTQQYIDMQAIWRSLATKHTSLSSYFDVWLVKSMSAEQWIWDDDGSSSAVGDVTVYSASAYSSSASAYSAVAYSASAYGSAYSSSASAYGSASADASVAYSAVAYSASADAAVGDVTASAYAYALHKDSHTFFVKQDETYIPGILNKTIVALNYFLSRHEYTHIWRTNLSSILDFDGLRLFLSSDVGRRCSYAGFCGDGFASGAGFLMIREAALYLVQNRDLVLSWDIIDDVAIGRLLCPIFGLTHIDRLWVKSVDDPILNCLLDGIFHFRCESHNHINTTTLMKKVCDVIDSVS
jgi:hypothetical protein